MKKYSVIFAFIFCAAMPVMLAAKNAAAVKPHQVKHTEIEHKLDTIVFKHISVRDIELEKFVTEISRYSTSVDPSGTGVKVVLFRDKHPTHNQKYMRLAEIPLITLDMKNVSLRKLLNELKKQSKCDYRIKKDHIEFIHKYVVKGSGK